MTTVPATACSEENTTPSGFHIYEENEENTTVLPQKVIESHPHEESNDYNMCVQ